MPNTPPTEHTRIVLWFLLCGLMMGLGLGWFTNRQKIDLLQQRQAILLDRIEHSQNCVPCP
jgi:hypothetical protein